MKTQFIMYFIDCWTENMAQYVINLGYNNDITLDLKHLKVCYVIVDKWCHAVSVN